MPIPGFLVNYITMVTPSTRRSPGSSWCRGGLVLLWVCLEVVVNGNGCSHYAFQWETWVAVGKRGCGSTSRIVIGRQSFMNKCDLEGIWSWIYLNIWKQLPLISSSHHGWKTKPRFINESKNEWREFLSAAPTELTSASCFMESVCQSITDNLSPSLSPSSSVTPFSQLTFISWDF